MKHKDWVNIFFIFIASCVVLLYGFIFLGHMVYENFEYPTKPANDYFISSKEDYDLVVLGTSKMKAAFLPNMLKGESSVNLSIAGATAFGNYLTLKNYLRKHKPPKKILLSIADRHLERADFFWHRNIQFGFISYCDYLEYGKIAEILNDIQNQEKVKQSFWAYKLNPKTYIPSFKATYNENFKRYSENKEKLKYLKENNGHSFFPKIIGLQKQEQYQKATFTTSPVLAYYLEKIVELALENNIEVYYYHTPFNAHTYDNLTDSWKKGYKEFFYKLQLKYPSVNFINNFPDRYMNDLFSDSAHLEKGIYKATEGIILGIYKDKKYIDYKFKEQHQQKYIK